jgi:hypothetical protein
MSDVKQRRYGTSRFPLGEKIGFSQELGEQREESAKVREFYKKKHLENQG